MKKTDLDKNLREAILPPPILQNLINNDLASLTSSKEPIRIKTKSHDSLFSCLHSNHCQDLLVDSHYQQEFHHFRNKLSDNEYYFADSSQVQMITFNRNQSDQFEHTYRHNQSQQLSNRDQLQREQLLAVVDKQGECIQREEQRVDRDQQLQNQRQYSNYSQQNIHCQSQHSKELPSKGFLVKNVTKNIGKLLFKFIWKHRTALNKSISVDHQTWDNFLLMVRNSKKHNNVTRQFLMARFHGEGEQFRLLRVVAHHFFRKHCLAAIFRSKLRAKRVHFQRIKKFDQALTNMRALDCLV